VTCAEVERASGEPSARKLEVSGCHAVVAERGLAARRVRGDRHASAVALALRQVAHGVEREAVDGERERDTPRAHGLGVDVVDREGESEPVRLKIETIEHLLG
jgi:hypothetical protein